MSKNLSHLSFKDHKQKNEGPHAVFPENIKTASLSSYDFTKEENSKKKVHLCNGTACLVAGQQKDVHTKLKKHFKENEIGHICCLGRCHENKSFMYNEKNYSGADIDKLEEILKKPNMNLKDNYNIKSLARETMLTPKNLNVEEIYKFAETFVDKPQAIINEIKTSHLRGRGGAGFPFHFKLESFSSATGSPKYIVCNADEGDPGAYSDRYLLENQPHLVLFGMLVCGLANKASEGVLYIRYEYPESIKSVQKAIDSIKINSDFKFRIVKGKGAYVCGEETALLNSIEGQKPEVRVRPPYPTIEGLYSRPTLLSNVETFANLYWILKNGGEAYSKYGSHNSKGNKLVCLDSCFNNPGVYEVEFGTPLTKIFSELGGGFRVPLKAMQIGGPLGGIVPLEKTKDLTLEFDSLQHNGFLLGHASIVGIPEKFKMIDFIHHLLEFTRDESCGKCYPCRIGSQRAFELVDNAIHKKEKISHELFSDLLWTMEKGSLCALGGGLPLPIKNAITYFKDELAQHISFKN